MQKEDLISLVTQMYEELIDNINVQEDPSKDQVVSFMQDATDSIASINDKDINSIEHAKLAFSNAYKEVAKQSLDEYGISNERFEELAQLHQETIEECSLEQIDMSSIQNKFNDIQSHMSKEVERANQVITKLTSKIKHLEKNSNIDSLTNVYNRRSLSSYLNNICSKKDIPYELHLLILDIDDFKKINDTFGHIAGDKILIFIANILKKTLRDGDKIFRYGGEEFVIVLNRIDTQSCMKISKRLLKLVSSNHLIYKGESINVTISIGATKYHPHDTPDTLIARADKALYKSKHNGKNQMNTETVN
jgi:diguanylate cyclase (GGDEF)-like protein